MARRARMVSALSSSRWISADPSRSHRPATRGGLAVSLYTCPASWQIQRPDRRRTSSSDGTSMLTAWSTLEPTPRQGGIEGFRLGPVAREAVEDDATRGIASLDSLEEHLDRGFVGHELAAFHVPARLEARPAIRHGQRRGRGRPSRRGARRGSRRGCPPGFLSRPQGHPAARRRSCGLRAPHGREDGVGHVVDGADTVHRSQHAGRAVVIDHVAQARQAGGPGGPGWSRACRPRAG